MRKIKLGSTLLAVMVFGMALTACGNQQEKHSQQTASSSSSQVNYKLASSSAKLDASSLTPKQNAALVLFYAGVKNHQQYVQQMSKNNQHLLVNLYSPADAKKAGVSANLPSGAEVVYKVSLSNSASSYYTIVGDQTYISNGHGGFRSQAVTTDEMVKLANQNNAGDAINQLAANASLNDLRSGAASSNSQKGDSNTSGEMTFDQAAALIQKGGFTDFNYDSAKDFHDGSHATSDGGYVMVTYPGAKGQDRFTITKKGNHKYHIDAVYGTLDGGSITAFDDQNSYGPSSADVAE